MADYINALMIVIPLCFIFFVLCRIGQELENILDTIREWKSEDNEPEAVNINGGQDD